MRGKGRGFSLGSMLTLGLTVVVVIGCALMLSMMRSDAGSVMMDARKVAGVLMEDLQGGEETAAPSPTVRTVMVTLPPDHALAASAAPSATSVPVRRSLRLTAAGMADFESEVAAAFYDKERKTCDYAALFSGIRERIDGDVNLVTLGSVLTAREGEYSDALAHPEAAAALKNAGFDTVLLPTERFLDQGAQAAQDTLAALKNQGIACCGLKTQDTASALLTERNGIRIGILAYTDRLNTKGGNMLLTGAGQGMSGPYAEENARQDISALRESGAELVIVCMNWGQADAQQVTSGQRDTARALAALGADLILGTRPSRLLAVEKIVTSGEDGTSRQAIVAYSLGTLVTESRQGYDISGALLHFDITVDELHDVEIQAISYTPTYLWRQKSEGKWQYRLVCSDEPAPAEMIQNQVEVMERSLKRVQDALQNVDMMSWD